MAFELPELAYELDALNPHLSRETLEYHFGKIHNGHVKKLNALVAETPFEDQSLDSLVREAEGETLIHAAQHRNNSCYWWSLSPEGGGEPGGLIAERFEADFGGFPEARAAFDEAALAHFGSGWAWFVRDAGGALAVKTTPNAECPLRDGLTPILACCLWEHAYYLDYRNARSKFIEAWWNLVNWEFANANLA